MKKISYLSAFCSLIVSLSTVAMNSGKQPPPPPPLGGFAIAGGNEYGLPPGLPEYPPPVDAEPMLMLDTTSSMEFPASLTQPTLLRKDLAQQILKPLIKWVEAFDAAGEEEEDEGGIRTTTFAGDKSNVAFYTKDFGNLNSKNFDAKWAELKWIGLTYMTPGFTQMCATYDREFGNKPEAEKPLKAVLILTDGSSETEEDLNAFTKAIAADPTARITVALMGDSRLCQYDPYNRKAEKIRVDASRRIVAADRFAKAAAVNPNIRFLDFNGRIDAVQMSSEIQTSMALQMGRVTPAPPVQ